VTRGRNDTLTVVAAQILSHMGNMPACSKARAKLAVDEAQGLLDEVSRRAAEAVRERTLEVVCRTLHVELRQFEADDTTRAVFTRMMGIEVLKALESAGLLRQEAP